MSRHLRIKSPGTQLGVLLLAFCLLYIASGVISLGIFKLNGIDVEKGLDLNAPGVVGLMKFTQAISTVIAFIVPAFFFARFTFTGNYGYFLGFRKAEKSNMYILAILGILMAFPFVLWLGQMNELIPLPEKLTRMEEEVVKQLTVILKTKTIWQLVGNVIIIALLPAIGEELFFRGALQRVVIQLCRNPWVGIVLTAVLFSALHLQFSGFLPRMFLGIVLGAFYWFSGSIYPNMIAHFTNNAVQVIAASYAPEYINKNPQTPLLAAAASGIVVWAILWFFQKQSTVTYSKVYDTDGLTPTNQFIA